MGVLAPKTRVAVLGGTGFLGARALHALASVPSIDALAASRRASVSVDVTRPETWEALAPFEVIVDLSDTVNHPPDALIAWCLARGKTVIEATSDAPCVERLHGAHRDGSHGALVLGAGIFTGVSNLLARAVAQSVGALEAVTLGVATSPFSGAGRGTVALMVHALKTPWVRYEGGARHESTSTPRGPSLDFGGVTRPTVRGSLAEAYMLRESLGAPTVDAFLAPKPGFLAAAFARVPAGIATSRWYLSALLGYFTVLRRLALRAIPTGVELFAEAKGAEGRVRRAALTRDGMSAAAWAIAAMTEAIAAQRDLRGARFIDEVCALDAVCARANSLAGETVIELRDVG